MTQSAPSLALALVGAALACGGCGAPTPAPRAPAVAQVVVPARAISSDDAARVDELSAAGFRCAEHATRETARVEFRVQSAARDGSMSAQTRAVYTITAEAGQDKRVARAEVVLESLSTDATDQAQSAWSVALDAGWISLRRPFEIVRKGSTWCLANACDDASLQEFAAAVGDTAELVVLPALTEQLTSAATGPSAITLPPVLVKRMGLGVVPPGQFARTAYRHGRTFPALFVVDYEHVTGPERDSVERATGNHPITHAELLVSRRCRLQALRVELARSGVSSAERAHRFSWSFEPLP